MYMQVDENVASSTGSLVTAITPKSKKKNAQTLSCYVPYHKILPKLAPSHQNLQKKKIK